MPKAVLTPFGHVLRGSSPAPGPSPSAPRSCDLVCDGYCQPSALRDTEALPPATCRWEAPHHPETVNLCHYSHGSGRTSRVVSRGVRGRVLHDDRPPQGSPHRPAHLCSHEHSIGAPGLPALLRSAVVSARSLRSLAPARTSGSHPGCLLPDSLLTGQHICVHVNTQSGRPDSNRGPPAPKAGALPGCATPRLAGWKGSPESGPSEGGGTGVGCFHPAQASHGHSFLRYSKV